VFHPLPFVRRRAIAFERSGTYIIFAVFAITLELWLASFSWRLVRKLGNLSEEGTYQAPSSFA
jgi:hypothetical protein